MHNQSLHIDSQKRCAFCKIRKNRAPFCLQVSLALERKKICVIENTRDVESDFNGNRNISYFSYRLACVGNLVAWSEQSKPQQLSKHVRGSTTTLWWFCFFLTKAMPT